MTEENKTAPTGGAEQEQATAPVQETQAAPAAEQQAAQPAEQTPQETAADAKAEAKAEKERKDWFGKKAREAEALKTKLEAAEKRAEETKTQLLRTAAEYDNYRKRSAREADTKFNDGVSFAVAQILSILDTLEMAANTACADENYKKGVTMTLEKAAKALEALGITEIEAEGQPFDPNLMSAVQQVPPEEGQESGQVVRVFQKGYKIGDKVVRHATVVVAE